MRRACRDVLPSPRDTAGCPPKEMASYVSWGRLTAASGMVGVTYVNGDPDGPHAFDMFDKSEASREIVRGILSFLQFDLLTAPATTTASAGNASRTT